jgi:UPF0176 protein
MPRYLIATFYHFTPLPDFCGLKLTYLEKCEELGVKGTLLLAAEGINGTLAAEEQSLRTFLEILRRDCRFADLKHKESWVDEEPFVRLKVRLKKEIVSLGILGVDPANIVGEYVKPKDWNALIKQPDVVVVDARNRYEIAMGSFPGAVDPQTTSFREFPAWVEHQQDLTPDTRVAMYCTGGIRCEKASSYLLQQGFKEIYHLEGGVLKYLEDIPEQDSLWDGECYVFDRRVSVDHELNPGRFSLCRACGRPIDAGEMKGPHFVEGVACSHCYNETSEQQRAGFAERQKQIELAVSRDRSHFEKQTNITNAPDPNDAPDSV